MVLLIVEVVVLFLAIALFLHRQGPLTLEESNARRKAVQGEFIENGQDKPVTEHKLARFIIMIIMLFILLNFWPVMLMGLGTILIAFLVLFMLAAIIRAMFKG